jgi:hypothetical protein
MIYETADKVLEVLKPAKRGLQVNFRAPTHAADKLVESLLNGANISSVAAAIDQTVNVESRRKADLIRFDEGHAFMKRNMNCVRDIVNEMKADSPFTETAKLTAVAYFAGPRWASWAGVERFFVDECGLETQGGPFASLVESCGWVWPHSDFAVIVDHPHSISQSEIVYRDGGHV